MSDEDQDAGLSDAQKAYLAVQAAQHVADAISPAADQAATLGQMTERGPELPAEADMERLMAALRLQSEQIEVLQQQVGVMQKQTEEREAVLGGPPVIRYAQGAADKIAATAVAHPDLGKDHFAAPAAAAADLLGAATALSRSGGSAAAVESAAARLDRWLSKTHWRTGRKYIDFSAIADDVEQAVEEAAKLASLAA
jgi:hypothetical protein